MSPDDILFGTLTGPTVTKAGPPPGPPPNFITIAAYDADPDADWDEDPNGDGMIITDGTGNIYVGIINDQGEIEDYDHKYIDVDTFVAFNTGDPCCVSLLSDSEDRIFYVPDVDRFFIENGGMGTTWIEAIDDIRTFLIASI